LLGGLARTGGSSVYVEHINLSAYPDARVVAWEMNTERSKRSWTADHRHALETLVTRLLGSMGWGSA